MATIILQLDPSKLYNPDLDIRYDLPDLLVKKLSGRLIDVGYDYVYVCKTESPFMHLFFRAADPVNVVPDIIAFLKVTRVLENDLSEVPIAIEENEALNVVYPPNFSGQLPRPDAK